jgi:hypothetical protein
LCPGAVCRDGFFTGNKTAFPLPIEQHMPECGTMNVADEMINKRYEKTGKIR